MIDVAVWAESTVGFYVDRTWHLGAGFSPGWRLGAGPIRLAGYHADLLRHLFTPGDDGRLPYDTVGWCEPAKSGKSAIAGLVAQYMGLHGEPNSDVVLASNKQRQASSQMYGSFVDSVTMNPALDLGPGRYEVKLPNGNTVRAIPSNSRGEAGARWTLAVFDELWGYVHTDAERLWSEFKTDPTRLRSVKMALGYAGYLESKLWLDLLEAGKAGRPVEALAHITNEGGAPACWANGRTFTFWSHECRQPWQTEAWREGLRATLRPAEYRRMVRTEFVAGVGDFIEQAAWEALVDDDHTPLAPGSSLPVYVGLDVALSPKGDDCALIGVYPEAGLTKVAFHRVWKAEDRTRKLRLSETVEPYLRQAAADYRIAGLYFDPFQCLDLSDRLRRYGIRCNEVHQTHATRGPKDTWLYEACVSERLMLYDSDDLRSMTMFANAKELGNGLIFITKQSRGKIDLLIALSCCANEAGRQVREYPKPAIIRY